MNTKKVSVILALAICAGILSAFEVPLNGKLVYDKKIMSVKQGTKRLIVTVPKKEKQLNFAGLTVMLPKPANFTKFSGATFTVKSNQPIKAKASFGSWKTRMSINNWPVSTVPANEETKIRLDGKLFQPSNGQDGSIGHVILFSFGFGLWESDITQEDLVIEISGVSVDLSGKSKGSSLQD